MGAAAVFRHLQEHGTAFEGHVARAWLEAEEGLRPEACESFVLKEQLGPGLRPGGHADVVFDRIPERGRACSGARLDDLYVIDDLMNFRLPQRGGEGGGTEQGEEGEGVELGCFHPICW
jgi:hypothetical protein